MIFKKQISILIAFLVLVSNSGLAFNIHFCKDKIASVTTVFSKDEICEMPVEPQDTCCPKAETSNKKCCSDKEINLKDKTEKVTIKFSVDSVYDFSVVKIYPSKFNYDLQILSAVRNFNYHFEANAPPLYLLYSQCTFYS